MAILTWHHSGPADFENANGWKLFQAIANHLSLEYPPSKNLMWRANSRRGSAQFAAFWSHHQKFIVTDVPGEDRSDLQVFYGGLDLTKGRSDSSSHGILAEDPEVNCHTKNLTTTAYDAYAAKTLTYDWEWEYGFASRSTFDDWYNSEFGGESMENGRWVRQPWHDIHARLRGPVAWDFAREFVMRWSNMSYSGDESSVSGSDAVEKVWKLFSETLMDRKQFRQQWEKPKDGGPWSGQLLHSFHHDHLCEPKTNPRWHPDRQEFTWNIQAANGSASDFERSIQDAYLRAIANAERFIHIENQYFIGSGREWIIPREWVQNEIPRALVSRILSRAEAKKPFHVYIVLPMMPEGNPFDSSMQGVRNLEWRTIAWMISALRAAKLTDWHRYLSFYFQARSDGASPIVDPDRGNADSDIAERIRLTRANKRYMVYVHSKLMIVDDRYVILGSANINERSMAGDRDTEICLSLWPSTNRVSAECVQQVADELRGPLLAEYFHGEGPSTSQGPETEEYVTAFQEAARKNYFRIREAKQCPGHLAMFPFDVAEDGESLASAYWVPTGPPPKLPFALTPSPAKFEIVGMDPPLDPDSRELSVEEGNRHRTLLDALWTPENPAGVKLTANYPAWTWAPELPLLFKKNARSGFLVE